MELVKSPKPRGPIITSTPARFSTRNAAKIRMPVKSKASSRPTAPIRRIAQVMASVTRVAARRGATRWIAASSRPSAINAVTGQRGSATAPLLVSPRSN